MNELEELIREEIRRDGPMTFARFMEVALYHPVLGYYAGGGMGREPLGWEGDYFTSGDVHPLWGWSIARQLEQMWELMGRPERFDVVEQGAGRGLLAREAWRYAGERAPEWASALRYTLVDRAPSDAPLRQAREQRLASELDALGVATDAVRWLGELPAEGAALTGCVVSNELVDALPVHIVEARGGELREMYVGLDEETGRLVELVGPPSSAEVAAYLDAYRIPWWTYPEGWRCEICLEAGDWVRGVASELKRGFVLTIDYGDTARKLYTKERRRGTLAVYMRHQLGERPLANMGRQDITAHVN
ncbi:MAG: class I SAM-dependent methyltransferase, partial [Ktedonobacterales bacterium]